MHIDTQASQRRARINWKRHVAKHGNVPIVSKCPICSGAEQRRDIKAGKYRPARPTKTERDEICGR